MTMIPTFSLRLTSYIDNVFLVSCNYVGIHETPEAGPGDCHIKGGYIEGTKTWTVKLANVSFYKNIAKGLPAGSGIFVVCDATNGAPLAIFQENRYLTDLRTGAAGALSGILSHTLAHIMVAPRDDDPSPILSHIPIFYSSFQSLTFHSNAHPTHISHLPYPMVCMFACLLSCLLSLSVKHFAAKNHTKVAFIGTGVIATAMARGTAPIHKFTEGFAYGLDTKATQAFADEIKATCGYTVKVCATAEEACRSADVIFTQTPGNKQVLELGWLKPHATIIASGSDQPTKVRSCF